MVRSAELLQGLKKASGKVRLGGSGSEIPVKGTGNFQLPLSSGKIQNIAGALFVPDLRKDLLSVAQITDAKMKVVFDASGVYLYQESAKVDGVSVASGTRRGNLYEIEIPVAMEEKALIAEVDKNALLWHCRLGHVGEQALQRLLKENMDVVFNEEKFPGPKPTDVDFILEENLPLVRSEIEIGVMMSTSRTRVIGEKTEGADCSTDQVPTRDSSNQEEVETEVLPPLDVPAELDQFEQTAIQGVENLVLDNSVPRYPISAYTKAQWLQAKRVLRYLNGTKHLGLKFSGEAGSLQLLAYTDASWGVSLLAGIVIPPGCHLDSPLAESLLTQF
ncbi:hypothetical protein R1flu_001840 [Riccia fluitans]|uniref:GAG-pre-integrase domain-containing protein n=1 Tax=Riccia fluitans TaxID=41844 RepID=A0ABD1Y4X1_9MARC